MKTAAPRVIAMRRDAVAARQFTRFRCLKFSVFLAAGLNPRDLAPAFTDAACTMACAAELDGGELTTKH